MAPTRCSRNCFPTGPQTRDRLAFQKALDDIAASETGGANFNLKVLKQYFAKGVELLADNELHPALPPTHSRLCATSRRNSPPARLPVPDTGPVRALEIRAAAEGRPGACGRLRRKSVSALTLADVKDYYAKVFRPDMTTIAVIGDITPEEARPVFEKWFGAWKNAGTKPAVTLPAVPTNKPAAVNVPDPTQVQDSVDLALEVGMNRFHPDYYALQLGNHVLGGGFYATRLYRDLRQKTGYVYNVDNALRATETRATYSVTYGCDPENVSKARLLVEQDLAAMRTTNVTAAELQQAKALLLRQITLSESSEDAVAGGFVARALIGLPLDEPMRAAQAILRALGGPGPGGLRKVDSSRGVCAGCPRAGAQIGAIRRPLVAAAVADASASGARRSSVFGLVPSSFSSTGPLPLPGARRSVGPVRIGIRIELAPAVQHG